MRDIAPSVACRIMMFGIIVVGLLWSPLPVACGAQEPLAMIQDNMDVSLDYTLTVDGNVVDSTQGKPTFHYVHGKGQIIRGLERQLTGLRVGDTKEVTVSPEEGYGQVDPAAIVEVSKQQLPKDVTPAAGMMLRGVNPDGRSFQAKIREVKDKTVLLDLNHPLAGKTLHFKVKVTKIEPVKASS